MNRFDCKTFQCSGGSLNLYRPIVQDTHLYPPIFLLFLDGFDIFYPQFDPDNRLLFPVSRNCAQHPH